jgi:23S rRNA pseudouridine955/2504/2580 synthase
MILTAGIDDAGRRLDRILRRALPDLPLSALHRFLRQGCILVNGSPAAGNDRIPAGAVIEVSAVLPPEHENHGVSRGKKAFNTPCSSASLRRQAKKNRTLAHTAPPVLPILWEGAGLLVLNKPAGLAVHGFPQSLDNQVQEYLSGKLPASLSYRPGPLHRLDKPTSGIIVFGVSLEAARHFSALLAEGKIRKRYLAILEGKVTEDQVWEDTLYRDKAARKTFVKAAQKIYVEEAGSRARRALTRVSPLAWAEKGGRSYTYVRLEIETGRTHQIRAQAACRGHPLAGDSKYGGSRFNGRGFFLHAAELELPEEAAENIIYFSRASGDSNRTTLRSGDGNSRKDFPPVIKAPLPEAFAQAVNDLFGISALPANTPH